MLDDFPARGAKALRGFRDLVLALQREAETLALPELLRGCSRPPATSRSTTRGTPTARRGWRTSRSSSPRRRSSPSRPRHRRPLESLTAFLDHVSLTTDLDAWQGGGGVMLMTLHSAKGLEFPIVVVAGLEEGVLPHFNSQGKLEDLEEERRLLYVGMTRAKERLLLSCCRRRRVAGRWQDQLESRFLAEVPENLVDVEESAERFVDERAWGVYSFFDKPAPRPWGSGAGGGGGRGGPERETGAQPAMAARSADARRAAARRPPGLRRRPPGSAPPVASRPGVQRPSRPSRCRAAAPRQRQRRRPAPRHQVRHPTLGQGVVMDVEGEGPTGRLTVYFEKFGKRKLVAQFAKLEPI